MKTKLKAPTGRNMIARGEAPGTEPTTTHPSCAQCGQPIERIGGLKILPIPATKQPLRESCWQSRYQRRRRALLLPFQFGDGKNEIILSFYHAPEIEILVKFDSHFPMDLPDAERFENYSGYRSFRDYLDHIYELAEKHIAIGRRSWARILENGSTWCHA